MYVIIPWIIKLAGLFELFFVNFIGLPFNSGTFVYCILLIGLVTWGLIYTKKRNRAVLNTILLSFTFIVIGYTSFLMLVIRSNARTPIDENNPANAMASWLTWDGNNTVTGRCSPAPITMHRSIDRKDGSPVYTREDKAGKYVITDKKRKITACL